ncbi:VOC family protein [Amycolatopsis sp.]|uniref:VOC family protein n=1 Tax=Amycolatopsis sp. TaxID=37632 RepID=UPI002CDCC9E3|nr:VOC family protein [Amycolatopsis sp.]HVV13146.1 VOC family protein [Amycolatopsis sp.]
MTFRDTPWPEGTPCWVDLMVADPERADRFYGELFGWETADQGEEYGHYRIALLEGRSVAAFGPKPPGMEQVPSVWTTYLAAADVDKTTARITEAGGQVLMPPGDVGDSGRMAMVVDPAGAAFGLWQAKENVGLQHVNVPGTLVWNECMNRDFDRAKAFYSQVFGYHLGDISNADFSYATLDLDGRPIGGLGGISEGDSHWSTYFGVADTDASVAKIVELGGSVSREPMDSPYGRMAQVADDQGVAFNVISVTG